MGECIETLIGKCNMSKDSDSLFPAIESNAKMSDENESSSEGDGDVDKLLTLSTGVSMELEEKVADVKVLKGNPSNGDALTTSQAVFHFLKGNIGAGCLSLPYACSKVGPYLACPLLLFCSVLSTYNMVLIVKSKRGLARDSINTFGDVGKATYGRCGQILIETFLVGTQLSFCCVYFTYVPSNLYAILPLEWKTSVDHRSLILLMFPIFILLSWIRTLKHITPYSLSATGAVLLGILIVFIYSILHLPQRPQELPSLIPTRLPSFLGNAIYAFEGIGLVLPVENAMMEKKDFMKVLVGCMSFITILYISIGEICLISFGEITDGSMTAVLGLFYHNFGVTLANLLLVFAVLFTFPIQFYVAMQVIEKKLIFSNVEESPYPNLIRWVCECLHYPDYLQISQLVLRTFICVLLLLCAILVPNVAILISFFGSIGSSMLALIIPPLIYMRVFKNLTNGHQIGLWLVVIFGIFIMISGTTQSVFDVISLYSS